MKYAQINGSSICVAVSEFWDAEINAPHMILLSEGQGEELLGKKYENGVWIDGPVVPVVIAVPEISDRQFFQALADHGDITEDEALDAVGPGIIPPAMDALIDQLPADQRFAARMLIRGATRYERTHPIADLIRSLYGWTPEQADDFWREAALL